MEHSKTLVRMPIMSDNRISAFISSPPYRRVLHVPKQHLLQISINIWFLCYWCEHVHGTFHHKFRKGFMKHGPGLLRKGGRWSGSASEISEGIVEGADFNMVRSVISLVLLIENLAIKDSPMSTKNAHLLWYQVLKTGCPCIKLHQSCNKQLSIFSSAKSVAI